MTSPFRRAAPAATAPPAVALPHSDNTGHDPASWPRKAAHGLVLAGSARSRPPANAPTTVAPPEEASGVALVSLPSQTTFGGPPWTLERLSSGIST